MNTPTENSPITDSSAAEDRVPAGFSLGLVGVCAIALCAMFFCPWIRILGAPLSGFDMARSGGDFRLFALVPLGALWALFADGSGGAVGVAKIVAGVMPLLLFAYYFNEIGTGLFDALQPGGFGVLGVSLALILVPGRPARKRPS